MPNCDLRNPGLHCIHNFFIIIFLMTKSWIQNVAKPRRNGRVGKVLELGEPRFHAAIAAIWNAISVLERFCRIATETAF